MLSVETSNQIRELVVQLCQKRGYSAEVQEKLLVRSLYSANLFLSNVAAEDMARLDGRVLAVMRVEEKGAWQGLEVSEATAEVALTERGGTRKCSERGNR